MVRSAAEASTKSKTFFDAKSYSQLQMPEFQFADSKSQEMSPLKAI